MGFGLSPNSAPMDAVARRPTPFRTEPPPMPYPQSVMDDPTTLYIPSLPWVGLGIFAIVVGFFIVIIVIIAGLDALDLSQPHQTKPGAGPHRRRRPPPSR